MMRPPAPGDGALVILLPNAAGAEVNKWRHLYDTHVEAIPPHITVIYPPFALGEEWAVLRADLIDSLATFQPFSITLEEMGIFAGAPQTLWLRPEDGGNLSLIHAKLTSRFSDYVPEIPFSYVPHVTLGLFDSSEALAAAQEKVAEEMEPLEFEVDALTYVVMDEGGVWQARDQITFGRRS